METTINMRDVAMVTALITGFVALISISVFYVYNLLHSGDFCSCTEQIPLIIIIVASAGLFIGSFAYYMLIDKIMRRFSYKKLSKEALNALANLLRADEKKVMKLLLEGKVLKQSEIVNKTKLSRVKVTRILQKFEAKGIIERSKKGKMVYVKLSKELEKSLSE